MNILLSTKIFAKSNKKVINNIFYLFLINTITLTLSNNCKSYPQTNNKSCLFCNRWNFNICIEMCYMFNDSTNIANHFRKQLCIVSLQETLCIVILLSIASTASQMVRGCWLDIAIIKYSMLIDCFYIDSRITLSDNF